MNETVAALLKEISGRLESIRLALTRETKPTAPEVERHVAFRWNTHGFFDPVLHPDLVDFDDLIGIDRQVVALRRNTEQLLSGLPSNDVLLYGANGTGKSSSVKALLRAYADRGLRLIEVPRAGLAHLDHIVDLLWGVDAFFILFCDDLSFDEIDDGFRQLKSMLEGGLTARPENIVIYATSNRRHLVRETLRENMLTANENAGAEIHPREAKDERLSLSERFGLRIGFHPMSLEQFMAIATHYAKKYDMAANEEFEAAAKAWAYERGFSGRSAQQFIRFYLGKCAHR